MSQLDWIILAVTLIGIIAYGLYKSRTTHNLDGYILANRSLPWGLVLLSIWAHRQVRSLFSLLLARHIQME
jgi:Na+/proline symporter